MTKKWWDFYRGLSLVYNLFLWIGTFIAVGLFYLHGALYTWPPDWALAHPVQIVAVLILTTGFTLYIKAMYWILHRARILREQWETENEEGWKK